MWDQYKKTFLRMQAVILAITVVVALATRNAPMVERFFFIMQIGSVAGVVWGLRLRSRFLASQGAMHGRSR